MNTYEAVQLADALLEQPRISAKELRHLLDSGALAELVHAARCSDAYEDDRPPVPYSPPTTEMGRILEAVGRQYIQSAVDQAASNQILRHLMNGGAVAQIGNGPPTIVTDFSVKMQPITDIARSQPGIGP